MARDFTDRKQIARLEKDARARDRQDALAITGLMDNMAGRGFILHQLERAHVFHTSFSTNALQMAFNEGERNRGLDLLNTVMTYCPEQYVLMMREANARNAATERSLSTDGDRGTEAGSERGDDFNQSDLYRDFDNRVQAGTVRIITDDDETGGDSEARD